MSTRLTIAAHERFPGELLDGAMPNGDSGLLVASGMTDFARALMTAERDHSQALLLFTPDVAEVTELLAAARTSQPEMALVVAVPGPANGSITEAISAGAHEIVILPAEKASVSGAVYKAMARIAMAPASRAVAPTETVPAPLVVVLGPKGGVGKTTVATNLATQLAADGKRTLVVDLDLQFGDVGLVLGVAPDHTIHDLVTAPGKLDGEKLHGFLGHSADGVSVLLAPVRPDQADAVTAEALEELLDVAAAEFDVVVVDTPPAFTNTAIVAIDRAQHAVMVGALDLPGLKNLKVGMETLDLMRFPRERVTVVLNRADSKVGLGSGDVKEILRSAPDVAVPSDRLVPRTVNAARPIVMAEPKSSPAKAMRSLSDRISTALFTTEG